MPYFALPDGKTEIDLSVDAFVPYLFDGGDLTKHKRMPVGCAENISQNVCDHFDIKTDDLHVMTEECVPVDKICDLDVLAE